MFPEFLSGGSVKKSLCLWKKMTPFGKNYDMKILSKRSIFMPVAKEQIRQIIADNNLSSVADVYSLLKDSLRISSRS